MSKYTTLCMLICLGLFSLSNNTNALDRQNNVDNKNCKKQTLHLNGQVDLIRWLSTGYTNFSGIVVYQGGGIGEIRGSFEGFCDLVMKRNLPPNNWQTNDELGKSPYSEDENFSGSIFDDTDGNSIPGLESDISNLGWLENRSTAYKHDIIGRDYHLTRLLALTNLAGQIRLIHLPPDRVFMSREPSSFPINCGKNKPQWGFFVVEGHVKHGPSIAVYGYHERRLQLLARTPWHGDKDGWINLIGIRNFDSDGCVEIAAIRDPQSDGILEIWELQHKKSQSDTPFTLVKRDHAKGFSNHVSGHRFSNISALPLIDSNLVPEIIVPNQTHDILRIMSASGDKLQEIGMIELPVPVTHNMTYITQLKPRTATKLVVPLEDNTIRLIPVEIGMTHTSEKK